MASTIQKVQRVVHGGTYDRAVVRTTRNAKQCEHLAGGRRCPVQLASGADYVHGSAPVGSFNRYVHCMLHVAASGGVIEEMER